MTYNRHGKNNPNYRHGIQHKPTYSSWQAMRSRCNQKNNKAYKNYGGRGITVCEAWNDFGTFLRDMGKKPAGYSLERINNDLSYSPENCKWTSRAEQNRNTRRTLKLEINGKIKCLKDWCREFHRNYLSVYHKIKTRGWPPLRAVLFIENESLRRRRLWRTHEN